MFRSLEQWQRQMWKTLYSNGLLTTVFRYFPMWQFFKFKNHFKDLIQTEYNEWNTDQMNDLEEVYSNLTNDLDGEALNRLQKIWVQFYKVKINVVVKVKVRVDIIDMLILIYNSFRFIIKSVQQYNEIGWIFRNFYEKDINCLSLNICLSFIYS